MEDFLKDRPVVPSAEAPVVLGGGMRPSAISSVPFAALRREPTPPAKAAAGAAPTAAKAGAATLPAAAETHAETGTHGTRVQTIVERGRVTRIIVTCSCGKVTELDCTY
jgi:hypothetical protein